MGSASVRIQPGAVLPCTEAVGAILPFGAQLEAHRCWVWPMGILRAVARWQMGRSYSLQQRS